MTALGAIMDDFGRWLETSYLDEARAVRATAVNDDLRELGQLLFACVDDVVMVLEAAGSRQVQVLAAIANWRMPDAAKEAIGDEICSRVNTIFESQFASVLSRPDEEIARDSIYSEWLTAPLIAALTISGLSLERFVSAYDGLAADAFSHMTRYQAWQHDRRRAIALIAIAGSVARNRNDEPLLGAVRDIAQHAMSHLLSRVLSTTKVQ